MNNRKIFIFGIGGTGARILRSLTMLMAAGVKMDPEVQKIIPIIVDVDAENADTFRAIQAMELYSAIRNQGYTSTQQEGFFVPRFITLGAERAVPVEEGKIKESFQLNFRGINRTFFEYLELNTVSPGTLQFMNSLFDNTSEMDDPKKELHLDLAKGFRGNPNLGSIIFNDLVHTEEFRYFEKSFGEHDRVMIISSIFGGTGSAGFPQLIRNLRNSQNQYLTTAPIGAIVVQPYFKVEHDVNSPIDSDIFLEKTKAALSYYEKEINSKIDRIYYIADPDPNNPYQNHEGGREQENDAHFIEMVAAYAATQFMNAHENNFGTGDPECFAFGLRNNSNPLTFQHFYEISQEELFTPLVYMTYFSLLFKEHLPGNFKMQFAQNLNLDASKLRSNRFYANLNRFLQDHFMTWLTEMARNQSHYFSPFNFNGGDPKHHFDDLIIGKEILKKGGLWGGRKPALSNDFFNKALNSEESKLKTSGVDNNEERFLRTFYNVCRKAFETYVQQLPTA